MWLQLDAKKSPLALLAQTCSQIGADPPTGKSLLGTLDSGKSSGKGSSSKSSGEQSREKSSPSSGGQGAAQPASTEGVRSSFKPYESCLGREKASSPEEQRAASSHSASGRSRTPGSKRCSSNQSASSGRAVTPQGRRTVTPNGEATRESPASRSASSSAAAGGLSEVSSGSRGQTGSPMSSKSVYSTAGMLGMTEQSMKDLPLGTFKPGATLPVSTSAAYLGYPPQLPIDVMASSLMSQHHAALKNGLASNPYLSYARMKTVSGVDTLVPVCRDPFCTGCQLNPHYLATSSASKVPTTTAASCPAGCAQCDHKPAPSPYGPLSAHTAAAYAHAQLAALAAASQLPYVCNWIAGDTAYCGKRFSSSEELLQHLRSHTSVSAGDPSAAAAALSLLSPPGLPPGHPLLSRTYPTPPLSPLATGRYHPYGKPSSMMQPSLSSLGLALPPHHPAAGLPPYFSPYSLYGGPRLGAASGMHPWVIGYYEGWSGAPLWSTERIPWIVNQPSIQRAYHAGGNTTFNCDFFVWSYTRRNAVLARFETADMWVCECDLLFRPREKPCTNVWRLLRHHWKRAWK